ncbi:MAG: alpha/beta hydrolase [bacterium]|nr:alpha/beta hydrolase [bacterium]
MRVAGVELEVMHLPALRSGAPTIVFLHEGLGSVRLWRDVPSRIRAATGFGAFVYSRRGNGFSQTLDAPRGVEYMHAEALDVLPALLDAAQLERPVLFGHSDGASIALIAAGAYPERVRALVLEAPHVFVEELSVASIAAIGERYRTSDLREKMARHHRDVDGTFFGWNDVWLSEAFRSWSIEASLPAIAVPVLVVQGVEDEYGTPAQLDAIARGCAGRVDRVLLEGCGHAPHRDRPDALELIAAWLRGNVA